MTTPQETLSRAAAIIRERGWAQRVSRSADGRVCVAAAINLATGDASSLYWKARGLVEKRAGTDSVTRWNDAPSRTVEEVLAVLEPAP